MFAQSYFKLEVLHNIFHNYFACRFYHLICFTIPEGDIIRITNNDYDKYFSISEWRKSGGSCDAKVKVKYQKGKK